MALQCVDVNVLVQACLAAAPRHQQARAWLLTHRGAAEGLGLFSVVVSGFLRVATDRRVFSEPLDAATAFSFIDSLTASSAVSILDPGPRHWGLFRQMVLDYRPSSVDMTDVYLAAAALEINATWVSFDRGFARFRELRWCNPADQ